MPFPLNSQPAWPDDLRPGRAVEVAPGVRRVVAPNPGLMTGPGTNTYLLGSDHLVLVDPGPDDDAHLEVLCELVSGRLDWILVTHTHVDHSPLAAKLKQRTGARVAGFGQPPAQLSGAPGLDAHDRGFVPDRLLGEGDRVETAEVRLEAVHTPGHTSNHLCYSLAGEGLLFSGDHVMSGSTVVIAPPDGDMAAYLESLDKVKGLAPTRIAPGHGGMIEDAAGVLNGYLRHRRRRELQVLEGLREAGARGATPGQLVAQIYTDVPAALHPVARFSVWAHLRKLAAEGRAFPEDPREQDQPSGLDARWVLAGRTASPPPPR